MIEFKNFEIISLLKGNKIRTFLLLVPKNLEYLSHFR